MKKANAILEYGILIVIVVSAIAGINYFLSRHIQTRVVAEARHTGLVQGLSADPGPGQGLEWASSLTFSHSTSSVDRSETIGGGVLSTSKTDGTYITASAPPPSLEGWSIMEHKGEAINAQDAPGAAPGITYPELEYKEWQDKPGEWLVQ